MAFDPSNDRWTSPCDLCGSLVGKVLQLPIAVPARRCGSCGLVTLEQSFTGNGSTRVTSLRASMRALEQTVREAATAGAKRALLIGRSSGRAYEALRSSGLDVTVLSDPGEEPPAGAILHTVRLEQAPFLPDQFDLIICTTSIETMDSPATLFEKSRMWLAPGGLLVAGGMNWAALNAQVSRRSWLMRNASRAHYLMTRRTLRRYADRFGYNVRSVQTYTRFDRSSESHEGLIGRIASAPLRLLMNLTGMGDEMYVELVKRGVAPITMPARVEEERDPAPGLAPAMYRGVHRERVVHEKAAAEQTRVSRIAQIVAARATPMLWTRSKLDHTKNTVIMPRTY